MKPPYIRTTKCPYRHKNLDYWYLLNKYSPKTQNYNVFFTSWMKSLIKMRKLNNWPKCFKPWGKKGLIVKDPLVIEYLIVSLDESFSLQDQIYLIACSWRSERYGCIWLSVLLFVDKSVGYCSGKVLYFFFSEMRFHWVLKIWRENISKSGSLVRLRGRKWTLSSLLSFIPEMIHVKQKWPFRYF